MFFGDILRFGFEDVKIYGTRNLMISYGINGTCGFTSGKVCVMIGMLRFVKRQYRGIGGRIDI